MNLGTNEIKYIYAGSTPAAQMYVGTTKVWPDTRGVNNIPTGWTKVDVA